MAFHPQRETRPNLTGTPDSSPGEPRYIGRASPGPPRVRKDRRTGGDAPWREPFPPRTAGLPGLATAVAFQSGQRCCGLASVRGGLARADLGAGGT